MLYAQEEKEWFGDEFMESFATTILDSTYHKVDLDEVINNQKHLTEQQQKELHKLLSKFAKFFDVTIVVYPHRKVQIELLEYAITKNARPYSLPQVHLEAFRKELCSL